MKKSKFCILLSVFFFFSCNEEENLSLNEIDNILDTFEEYVSSNNHSSDYIYDENKLHRFNLYLNDDMIRIMGKGSKERLLPVGGRAKNFLNDYLIHCRPGIQKDKGSSSVFLSRNGKPLTRMMIFNILETSN